VELILKKRINTMTFVTAMLLFSLITGCINIDYIGQRYPETTNRNTIEFYNNSKEVPDDKYVVMGRVVTTAPDSYTSEEIKNELLDKAQACGADAIQIIDFKRILVSQQQIPLGSAYDNGPVGSWGRRGVRADGSPIGVDAAGKTVALKSKVHDRYELKARALFLRLKSKSNIQGPIVKKLPEPATKLKTKPVTENKPAKSDVTPAK
jgi:hypothetical protein